MTRPIRITSRSRGAFSQRDTVGWLIKSAPLVRQIQRHWPGTHIAIRLASDRTICRSALANQVRLILHTAAYWLMLSVRDTVPGIQPLARAEFTTLRLRLLKIGARVSETASRVRIAFAASFPEAALVRGIAAALAPAPA